MGHSKGSPKEKLLAMNAYIKNIERTNKQLNAIPQTSRKRKMN
jgi:hypothetical protein